MAALSWFLAKEAKNSPYFLKLLMGVSIAESFTEKFI